MKQFEEFPDYYVTENGDVWSKKYHPTQNKNCELRKLKTSLDGGGYLKIILHKNKKKYTKKIHRLVALNLIPNPKNLREINHINGIKTDNRLENLEWVTPSQNTRHSFYMGLQKPIKGEKNSRSKLTIEQVIEIREKYKTGQFSQRKLAKEYGISRSLICFIVNNKNWKHI